jgi:hypothetical protein
MKLLSKLIILVVVFFAGVYVGGEKFFEFGDPIEVPRISFQAEDQAEAVSFMIDDGLNPIVTYHDVVIAEGDTVMDVLKRLSVEHNFELASQDYGSEPGIRGSGNDAQANRFWQFWVNNIYAKVGASNTGLEPGDVVVWKLVEDQLQPQD